MNRNLDRIYYRVERDDEWENICFTDLTEEEIKNFTSDYEKEQWERIALHLRDRIKRMGEELNIINVEED